MQGALSDGEEVESGTSELRDLEFKLFHNLADLQVHIHTCIHACNVYTCTCTCM